MATPANMRMLPIHPRPPALVALALGLALSCGTYPTAPTIPAPATVAAYQAQPGIDTDAASQTVWVETPREAITFVPDAGLRPILAAATAVLGLPNDDEVLAIARGNTIDLLVSSRTWYEYERSSSGVGSVGVPITDPWVCLASTAEQRRTPVAVDERGQVTLAAPPDAADSYILTALWVGKGREHAIEIWGGTANGLLMSWTLESPATALRTARSRRTVKLDGPRLHLLGERVQPDVIRDVTAIDANRLVAITRRGDALFIDRRDRRVTQGVASGLWNAFAVAVLHLGDRPRIVIGGRHPQTPLVMVSQNDAGLWAPVHRIEFPDVITCLASMPGQPVCAIGTLRRGALLLGIAGPRVELRTLSSEFTTNTVTSLRFTPNGEWLSIGPLTPRVNSGTDRLDRCAAMRLVQLRPPTTADQPPTVGVAIHGPTVPFGDSIQFLSRGSLLVSATSNSLAAYSLTWNDDADRVPMQPQSRPFKER